MARELFIDKIFNPEHESIIKRANEIIAGYQAEDLKITLRQLYYQFVTRNWIRNKFQEYKRLGSIINDARLAGRIDWDAIEDRIRGLDSMSTWDRPANILEAVARQYREDLWDAQDYRVEVWVEKDALTGIVERAVQPYRVPFLACRGYCSQSELYNAGQRFAQYAAQGQRGIVIHLGDHDPSGIDMTRDNTERLEMFAGAPVEVRRIALNYDQVEKYRIPPNPAKETDSRAGGYIERYGESSWELDAIEPARLRELIQEEIASYIDEDRWNASKAKETDSRGRLTVLARKWTKDADKAGE